MRVVLVGSGSQGNATLFASDRTRIMVDAGLSVRELRRRLAALGEEERLDALVVTHSHGDHAAHARRVATAFSVPVFLTAETKRALGERLGDATTEQLPKHGSVCVGDITIRSAPVPHDAPQVALMVRSRDCVADTALVTDLGCVPAPLVDALAECETLLLESNHCQEMLQYAPYPPALKHRIAGPRGHLSNGQAAALVSMLPRLRRLVLMHLSQKANSPRRARRVMEDVLVGRSTELLLADQYEPTVLPALETERVVPVRVSEQLSLF